MARSTCEELLEEYRRPGTRTYRETRELLLACGFQERVTPKQHAVWKGPRGSTLTLTTDRYLKHYYKALIERTIRSLRLLDD
ncbi:MAG TPA: hypothetical protein VHR45_17570 [Thermoanaerobaculia bacterium]|nr:hypothetical protein [Thermoanaerobaculia bacterium]